MSQLSSKGTASSASARAISARSSRKPRRSQARRMKNSPVSRSACWSASRMLPSLRKTNSDSAATNPVRSWQLTSKVAVTDGGSGGADESNDPSGDAADDGERAPDDMVRDSLTGYSAPMWL